MSDRDLTLTGTGSDWLYLLSVLLFIVGTTGVCALIWAVIHAPLIHARGRAYRRRLRNARHVQPHRLARSNAR